MAEFPKFDIAEPEETVWASCTKGLAFFTIILTLMWLL